MNLASILTDSARLHPDTVALRLGAETISYRTLDRVSAEVAGLLLSRGMRPGDRVGLMLPNVPHFAALYYGILRAGGVVVPMNSMLVRREVTYYLEDSGATELFVWHEAAHTAPDHALAVHPGTFADLLAQADPLPEHVPRDEDDTAVILYTSGTTGHPKGAELTHASLRRNAASMQRTAGMRAGTTVLGCLPLFHSFGQTCALNAAITVGGTLTLMERFDGAAVLDLIDTDHVEVFLGVPTMYSAMLHAPTAQGRSLPSLRVCISGGAALPAELLHAFEATFGCAILEGYGLSETSPVASFNRVDLPRKVGTVGLPIEGVQIAIRTPEGTHAGPGEVGEVLIRGHNVMKGYWQRPTATRETIDEDGWLRTGDLGVLDADGYLSIVDRIKDLIIRGGYNVYPREIEEIVHEHPSVREAAVVGIPDDRLGEEVGLAVSLRPGTQVSADELRDFVRQSVAPYKYPRVIWFLDDLPKGPSGKILKRSIATPTR